MSAAGGDGAWPANFGLSRILIHSAVKRSGALPIVANATLPISCREPHVHPGCARPSGRVRVSPDPSGRQSPEKAKPIRKLSFGRSEEHTSELQSLMRTSYAVLCLKKKKRPH